MNQDSSTHAHPERMPGRNESPGEPRVNERAVQRSERFLAHLRETLERVKRRKLRCS